MRDVLSGGCMHTVLAPNAPWPTKPNPELSATDKETMRVIKDARGIGAKGLAEARRMSYQSVKKHLFRLRKAGLLDCRLERIVGERTQTFYFVREEA